MDTAKFIYRDNLSAPQVSPPPRVPQTPPSPHVTVTWAWTNKANGNISWTFVNSDKDSSQAVVLYRGATSAGGDVPNYIFGGAFWPIYLRAGCAIPYAGWNAADTDIIQ